MSFQKDKAKDKKVMAKRSDSNGRANRFSEDMKAKAVKSQELLKHLVKINQRLRDNYGNASIYLCQDCA